MRRMPTDEEIIQITKNKTDIEALKSGKVNCYEATNLTTLTKDFCNKLKAGDVVLKKTGTSYHAYRVSFKKDSEGLCLTYTDAGYMETVSYDKSETNWVYNSTNVVNVNRLEQIVDSNGNPRFLEGNGQYTIDEDVIGVLYCKWSLSGSHLMVVITGRFASSKAIPQYKPLATYELPDFIINKIYSVTGAHYGNISRIDIKLFTQTVEAISTEAGYGYINEDSPNILRILCRDGFTTSANEYNFFRAQLDLIIDTEYN